MHILATTSATLDDLIEPVDLRQAPADVLVLSFTDSDLAGLAAAWEIDRQVLPSLQLTHLRDLRHPLSVDLWLDRIGTQTKVILVRVLGGYDWWRYGCDRLADFARTKGIMLALLPGEDHDDRRLAELSTVKAEELNTLLAYFRESGVDNLRALLRRLASLAGHSIVAPPPKAVPRAGFYRPGRGVVESAGTSHDGAKPVVAILFYRSMLLAADVEPIDALFDQLAARGFDPIAIFVAGLKDETSLRFTESALRDLHPHVILTTTAFAAGSEGGAPNLFDRCGVSVLQVIIATTRREAWASHVRGLAPADLAMHVVMPELDGRVLAGAISFKAPAAEREGLAFRGLVNRSEDDRIDHVVDRVAALVRLQKTPPAERRVAVLMPDYPGAAGRAGYAVGLDVPASVLAMLDDLRAAGYGVEAPPSSSRELLARLDKAEGKLSLDDYVRHFAALPDQVRRDIHASWGEPGDDPDCTSSGFSFRAAIFGNSVVALAPDRGRVLDRRADYHNAALPPRHALIAFGFWLRHALDVDALVHLGAHGTLEWLPGKNVALTACCYPEIVAGALPVIYPFIVSNPGEAAQAKRRIAALTIGHLSPPLIEAGSNDATQKLERLVDEYAQADGLDRRRRERLAALILDEAQQAGLAVEAGVTGDTNPDEALRRIDAWLCDLKDFSIKDGLHVYGRDAPCESDPLRLSSAVKEREALLAALEGCHITAGPAGAPARGRRDVLPTGRNLFTADPRGLPTPTAYDLGRRAAEEVLRRYCQDHGDWPRALVIDLWGSSNLRTGGEEIAQGLALMGCRPQWEAASGRVTGIEVLPPASIGRPRVDVTWRISGLFRDLFPAQIALLDAAARAVAKRDEPDDENSLAAEFRRGGKWPLRIFGSAPGVYGAGVEAMLASGDWASRDELGHAYLAAASHVFGSAEGDATAAPGVFSARVAEADLLLHTGDNPGRDLLEGTADAAFIGGFAAAARALGKIADLVTLDTRDPARPRAFRLAENLARIVRSRATNPRFIEGQMRHGPRGAAEFAETVDRLIDFAETTDAVPAVLIDRLFAAYIVDDRVREFILRENPAAARAMAERFAAARRRGYWYSLRNDVDAGLDEMLAGSA